MLKNKTYNYFLIFLTSNTTKLSLKFILLILFIFYSWGWSLISLCHLDRDVSGLNKNNSKIEKFKILAEQHTWKSSKVLMYVIILYSFEVWSISYFIWLCLHATVVTWHIFCTKTESDMTIENDMIWMHGVNLNKCKL